MHLLITGGNGFIGRDVCRQAVADGHDVTSVARSGPPDPEWRGPWADEVTWVGADVFEPQQYRDFLAGVDAVVHSIGIIDEDPDDGVTFERINGDSAILTALEAERAGVDRFVYISSSTTPPFTDQQYLDARRRAEQAIADLDMSVAVPRFGPVYGPGQPHFPSVVNRLFAALGRFEFVARRFGADRPFSVEQAGTVVCRLATMADAPEGVVEAEELARLS
jgi:uncharacterized protein YbjT (DUF2867 family)